MKSYFASRIGFILLLACFAVVFAVTFALFGLPYQAAVYGGLINLFVLAVVFTADFCAFLKKHKALMELKNSVETGLDRLPPAGNAIESDYSDALKTLYAEKQRIADEYRENARDVAEYYTLWAHQIKTPIAAMRLLLQGKNGEEYREISEELSRIEQYVEMVLCYVRLGEGGYDLVLREYDLDGIIKQAVRRFAPQFIRKKLKLCYEPVCKTVVTDEKWLLFVLEQLISNSLKYTKTGSISIYVKEPLTLVIADTGIGIDSADLPRVTERGYTGMNGRLNKKASGIGLFLCVRTLEMLSHTFSIDSALGKGTAVYIGLDSHRYGRE